jgi:hypothetical protein
LFEPIIPHQHFLDPPLGSTPAVCGCTCMHQPFRTNLRVAGNTVITHAGTVPERIWDRSFVPFKICYTKPIYVYITYVPSGTE